jgi:hypothetical protein
MARYLVTSQPPAVPPVSGIEDVAVRMWAQALMQYLAAQEKRIADLEAKVKALGG